MWLLSLQLIHLLSLIKPLIVASYWITCDFFIIAPFNKTLITTWNCYNPIELDVASPFAINSLGDP